MYSRRSAGLSLHGFPPLGNSGHLVVSVSIDFSSYSQRDALFIALLMTILVLIGTVFMIIWEMFHCRISLNSVLLLLLVNFVNGFRLGLSGFKPQSSPWFSAACAAAIVHKNHFFRLYQKNKSSESKVKLRQASNHCKRIFEDAKLTYANTTKESITSQKLGSLEFLWIANSVLNKVKSAIVPLFKGLEVLSSASDKANMFPENFSKNSNLDDSGISKPVFPSITNLKLHNISITPKTIKDVIMNLDLSKESCPDCIPVVVLKNCEFELSYILAELLKICLKESCFPDCWKDRWSLSLKLLGKGQKLITPTLLVFFLWLVKSLKNL